MLDFEAAKRVVQEHFLAAFDEKPGGPQLIRDDECVEFEWGWLIEYGPSRPNECPPGGTSSCRVLVDRMTGHTKYVGSYGINLAICKLLEGRPTEYASPDLTSENLGRLTKVSVSTRAFTPLRELEENGGKVPESESIIELYRTGGQKTEIHNAQ